MPSRSELILYRRYWHRSILWPLWTQQLLLQLVGCIIFWFAITIFWGGGPNHGKGPQPDRKEQAVLAAFFILYLTLLLATLGEILLYCAKSLQPKGYLISQLLKFATSCGVWASLVLYPYVIVRPIYSRKQVAIGMEAVFAWLQIPMLSALVHAGLVAYEEHKIKREQRERSEALQQAADAMGPDTRVTQCHERSPLLTDQYVAYVDRGRVGRSIGGPSRAL